MKIIKDFSATDINLAYNLPYKDIVEFCQRWEIAKLELFGSILRADFGPHSDVDFLVTFAPAARWSLFDLVKAEEELSCIVGRPVDLVEREPIEQSSNWIRRKAILESARSIYVAG
jgi:predicted nucleotidyltransferase